MYELLNPRWMGGVPIQTVGMAVLAFTSYHACWRVIFDSWVIIRIALIITVVSGGSMTSILWNPWRKRLL